jgi:hypothetical protein
VRFGEKVIPYIQDKQEVVQGEVVPRPIGVVEISVSKYNVVGR